MITPLYLKELKRCHNIIEDLAEEFDGDTEAGRALWKRNMYSHDSSRVSYRDYCVTKEMKAEDRRDREAGVVWFY